MHNATRAVSLGELVGLTCSRVDVDNDADEIKFTTTCGRKFLLYHEQDCCESVYIESIIGDVNDLVGSPITLAEEVSGLSAPPMDEDDESYTWTFYKFATVKGYVDVRFYSCSNGYYSEEVSFVEYVNSFLPPRSN